MKKILALVLAMIMAFSLAAPAYAAVPEIDEDQISSAIGDVSTEASEAIDAANGICDNFKNGAYGEALKGAFDFAIELFEAIHSLVHALSEIFDFGCPFCDEGLVDDGSNGDADNDCTCGKDDCTCGGDNEGDNGEEEAPLYETADKVIGAEFANKDMKFDLDYPQNVDVAYAFTAPTKSIVIDSMATANVKTVVILEDGATTGKLVFSDNTVYNYFHAVEGFKLLINNSGASVAIVLDGEIRLSNGTYITAANIGDYVEGPYTVSVTA